MRIAFIGDLHYPVVEENEATVKEARDAFYAEFLHRFFATEADYYISLGDLTNYGEESEVREVYELITRHNKNFIHVFGNHDLYDIPRQALLDQSKMNQNYSIETEEAYLVFLETARDHDYENYGGFLHDEQLQWLEAEIERSGEKTMMIFAHHPVYDTTARSQRKYLSIDPELNVQDILNKKQGTGIYINGHNHVDSIVYSGQWTYIQAGAVLDDQSIRILEIDNDRICLQAKELNDSQLKQLAEIVGQHISHFNLFPEGRGTTLNREAVIQTTAVKRL
ncbi:metallophosphoesterase [Bacillaceae bacterium SIJ1]|uniref:metallophosphoesterase family protein n=1 Tax=Litoribacterium kuwaitense TaxID=1398745 RepID=UPI0013EA78A8|nr:metallophosphoesterase [Litoribacterium kuwaitense]NGP44027.1 metallophosphoesterase [Litoribacterium kuwaitense]